MTFDALAMHAVRDELASFILGGRIDDAYLVDSRQVALEIYAGRRFTLVFSLDPSDSRLYLAEERMRRGFDSPPPFGLLLRKYVRRSRIEAVEQPRLERVLRLRLRSRLKGELPRQVELVAEVMGRRSNLVLIDEDGTIMDALARVPPRVNPSRPLLPHLRYTPPPPEHKLDPMDPALASELAEAAAQGTGDGGQGTDRGAQRRRASPIDLAADVLVSAVAGLSPLAAREALARAGIEPGVAASEVQAWAPVAAELHGLASLVDTGAWTPTIAWPRSSDDPPRSGEPAVAEAPGRAGPMAAAPSRAGPMAAAPSRPLAYAPYELRQFRDAEVRRYATMSEVLRTAAAPRLAAAPFQRLTQPLAKALTDALEKARRKRSSLERTLASAERAEALRGAGEAILANAHAIEPGANALVHEGQRIDLYPTLSAAENAQAYFRQYADARDAKRKVPRLLNEVAGEIAYLDEMMTHVQLAEGESEIAALRRELEEAGFVVERIGAGALAQAPRRVGPMAAAPSRARAKALRSEGRTRSPTSHGAYRHLALQGAELLVGTSARGNEMVTFRLAKPDDLWLHARGVPGAHVVLRTAASPASEEHIEAAARVAAQRSAAREAGRVEVDYTARKYVRKVRGGAPGLVTYRNERTILVSPASFQQPAISHQRGTTG